MSQRKNDKLIYDGIELLIKWNFSDKLPHIWTISIKPVDENYKFYQRASKNRVAIAAPKHDANLTWLFLLIFTFHTRIDITLKIKISIEHYKIWKLYIAKREFK